MPRALVVSYPWLPLYSVGVKQVAALCRYLPAADWEPHVLTKDWTEGPSADDNDLGMSVQALDGLPSLANAERLPTVRASGALRENRWLQWQERLSPPMFRRHAEAYRGWVESAVDTGLATVRQFGISAVVSVCPPVSTHLVGGEIASRAGIPWVVVFADLAGFYTGPGDGRSRQRRWEDRALARRWLRGAARAACASPAMLAYVRETFDIDGDVVVPAFDPDEQRLAPHRAADAPLRVVHTSRTPPDARCAAIVADALDGMLAENSALEERLVIELVGSKIDVSGRPCERMVRSQPCVAPAEALRLQREADVLMAFDRRGEGADRLRGPSIVFEYMNAGRPIVAVGADDTGHISQLFAETRAGDIASDAVALVSVLHRHLDALRESGVIAFRGDVSAIAKYGAPEQARRLGALVDAASGERFGSWVRASR